jgi:acyl-CoA thioester hydrolase
MHHDIQIRVRYAETDQMGIVYHANYFPWFEEGRTYFLEDIGLSYAALEADGFYFPLLECSCRYKSPARYPDQLTVRTRLEKLKGIQVIVGYDVLRSADGALLAQGRTVHAFVDREFRPVNMPRLRPDVWAALTAQLESQPNVL